jgi:hypothetical protein
LIVQFCRCSCVSALGEHLIKLVSDLCVE